MPCQWWPTPSGRKRALCRNALSRPLRVQSSSEFRWLWVVWSWVLTALSVTIDYVLWLWAPPINALGRLSYTRAANNLFNPCNSHFSDAVKNKSTSFTPASGMVNAVELAADTYLVCLNHALSTEKEEIMGLLLGEVWDDCGVRLYFRWCRLTLYQP